MTPTLFTTAFLIASHANGWGALLVAGRELSQQAAAMAIASAWQGLLIAFGLALCLRVAPRTSAEYRFTLWAAAFVSIASLPLLKSVAGMWTNSGAGFAAATPTATATPLVTLDARWSFAIAALWIAAAAVRTGDLVMHTIRVRRIWRDALPVEMEDRLPTMPALLRATSGGALAEVCTTTMLQRPCVIGFFRPRILIPDWLFTRLTDGELEQIVLHETEHLRRRDDWTNLLQKVGLVLFPLNPALYWIERRLCREREMACDDGVIRITRAPRAYAACLASLAERGLQRRAEALSLGAWQRRPEVVHRVHSILRRTQALHPIAGAALLGVTGCGLILGSIALARSPQLVAFVPEQSLDRRALSSADGMHAATARIDDASVSQDRDAGLNRATTGVRAIRVKEISKGQTAPAGAMDGPRALARQDVAFVGETSTQAPNAQMIKARFDNAQQVSQAAQEWVFVAAWEQVQLPARQAGLIADYDTGTTNAESATQTAASAPEQRSDGAAGQMVVTQLIFRFIPASSVAGHGSGSAHEKAAAAPMHNGWFVLQL